MLKFKLGCYNLAEVLDPLELVQQIINYWQRVFVLDGYRIQGAVINAHSHGPILLTYEQDW